MLARAVNVDVSEFVFGTNAAVRELTHITHQLKTKPELVPISDTHTHTPRETAEEQTSSEWARKLIRGRRANKRRIDWLPVMGPEGGGGEEEKQEGNERTGTKMI